ncbi:hypothetical protein EAY29_24880, partial [Vibrio anguillarum]
MKVLFWNLNNQSLVEEICSLVLEHDVDVLSLAEVSDDVVGDLEQRLSGLDKNYELVITPGC